MVERSIAPRLYSSGCAWLTRCHSVRHFCAAAKPISPLQKALTESSSCLVGVGRLVAMLPDSRVPYPKPFGFHVARGGQCDPLLQEFTIDVDFVNPVSDIDVHCRYAVRNEFPWFPFVSSLDTAEEVKSEIACAIPPLVEAGSEMARRWWFAYELFFERLQFNNEVEMLKINIPFLPPERFFCTAGIPSSRHGVLDNLLGGKDFCPFVEKFSGADEAAAKFRSELLEVLSPICMMTIKEFMDEAGLSTGSVVDRGKVEHLIQQLVDGGFLMSEADHEEILRVFGVHGSQEDSTSVNRSASAANMITTHSASSASESSATGLLEFAHWLRGNSGLASRLREHILGTSPSDLRWRAPGEVFLERLSRVVSNIETRSSQMIEGELPPDIKQRFFVDEMSKPYDRSEFTTIDADLVARLQHGLLSTKRYEEVISSQVEGEPRRIHQNWVSSEEYDDMTGKEKLLHHLPPPPSVLKKLLDGYFMCMQRMLDDPNVDPIVCATIAKVGLNVLHPMVDGNGRVQRFLFQLVLFKTGFLPRMNVPVSVIMLQDRTGYETMQQTHVDQFMSSVVYTQGKREGEGDVYDHVGEPENIAKLYQYQDFTFAASAMIKLLRSTLPVIAAKAYFLQRFDWRVDELLKGDPLLPPRAATKIAKVFKNDGHGMSWTKLLKLLFLDGWSIGFKRTVRFISMAKHPRDNFVIDRIRSRVSEYYKRSQRRHWIAKSGQQSAASSTARTTWVGISLKPDEFYYSELALKFALSMAKAGDTVMAVHYPDNMHAFLSMDLYPKVANDILQEISTVRSNMLSKVQSVVDSVKREDVEFKAFLGSSSTYKPAHALCEDAKIADVKPFRLYIGYGGKQNNLFTDYIVQNAPCDVSITKLDSRATSKTRWVGISSRNFSVSIAALIKAFRHSRPGDTVIAVHYPENPFQDEPLSRMYYRHMTSTSSVTSLSDPTLSSMSSLSDADVYIDKIVNNVQQRVFERITQAAEAHCKDGIEFKTKLGERTSEPHRTLVEDAAVDCPDKPTSIYVGFTRREDRDRLVAPKKLFDVAEYIVHHAPCNVVVVKETAEEMAERKRLRKLATNV